MQQLPSNAKQLQPITIIHDLPQCEIRTAVAGTHTTKDLAIRAFKILPGDLTSNIATMPGALKEFGYEILVHSQEHRRILVGKISADKVALEPFPLYENEYFVKINGICTAMPAQLFEAIFEPCK